MKKKTLLFLVVLALSLVGCSNTTSSTTTSTDTTPHVERVSGVKNEDVLFASLLMYNEILDDIFETKPTISPLYTFGAYGEESDVYVLMADIEMFREYEEQELIKWRGTYTFRAEISDTNTAAKSYKDYVFKKMPETVTILHDNKVYDLEEAYSENLLSIGEIEDIYCQFVELFGMPKESDFEEVNIGIKNAEGQALAIQMGCQILNSLTIAEYSEEPATEEDVQLVHFFGAYGENNDAYVILSSNILLGIQMIYIPENTPILENSYWVDVVRELSETTDEKYADKFYRFELLPQQIVVLQDDELYSLNAAYDRGIIGLKEIHDIYWQFINLLPKNS